MKNFLIREEKWKDQPKWVKVCTFIFASSALLMLIASILDKSKEALTECEQIIKNKIIS